MLDGRWRIHLKGSGKCESRSSWSIVQYHTPCIDLWPRYCIAPFHFSHEERMKISREKSFHVEVVAPLLPITTSSYTNFDPLIYNRPSNHQLESRCLQWPMSKDTIWNRALIAHLQPTTIILANCNESGIH